MRGLFFMASLVFNKKATGFSLWLVLITFILFALMVAFSIKANNETLSTLGVWGSDQIGRQVTVNEFFLDTMNIGLSKSIESLAKDSFIVTEGLSSSSTQLSEEPINKPKPVPNAGGISPPPEEEPLPPEGEPGGGEPSEPIIIFLDTTSNPACEFTPEGIVIFDEDCHPDLDLIKKKIVDDVTHYFEESFEIYAMSYSFRLYQIDIAHPSCRFEGDLLVCTSGEQFISYERKTNYFTYNLSYHFIVNQSINISERLNLSEIVELYKKDPKEPLLLEKWDVANKKEDSTHYTFFLRLKDKLFDLGTYSLIPVDFNFALRKPQQNP